MEASYLGYKLDSTSNGVDIFKITNRGEAYVKSIIAEEIPNPPKTENGWIREGQKAVDQMES